MGATRMVDAPGRCLPDCARIHLLGEYTDRWLAMRQKDMETERRRDGETERQGESSSVSPSLRLSVSLPPSTVRRRKWTRRALISLSLLSALCVALFFALPALLIAPPNVAPSDVILHFSISPKSRAD